jgi:hypothetical protein
MPVAAPLLRGCFRRLTRIWTSFYLPLRENLSSGPAISPSKRMSLGLWRREVDTISKAMIPLGSIIQSADMGELIHTVVYNRFTGFISERKVAYAVLIG